MSADNDDPSEAEQRAADLLEEARRETFELAGRLESDLLMIEDDLSGEQADRIDDLIGELGDLSTEFSTAEEMLHSDSSGDQLRDD